MYVVDGSGSFPIIRKIDLTTFSEIASLTLTQQPGINLYSGIIGSSKNIAYFWGYDSSQGESIFKINLNTFAYEYSIFLGNGFIPSYSIELVIDSNENYLYKIDRYTIYYLNLQNNNLSPYVSFSPTNKSNGPIESLAVNVAKMDSTSAYMYIFGFEYNTTPEKFYYCYKIQVSDLTKIATSPQLLPRTIGGSGNNFGAILGGFVVWFLWIEAAPIALFLINMFTSGLDDAHVLKVHLIESIPYFRYLMMGIGLLLIMRYRPKGILPEKIEIK